MKKKIKEINDSSWLSFSAIGLLVVAILCFYLFWVVKASAVTLDDISRIGALGDSSGVVNTLFSGLAFAGVIFAIILQRRELELQRKELEASRKEFQVNRLTNIVYKEIGKCSNSISSFHFQIKQRKFSGFGAILYVERQLQDIQKNWEAIVDSKSKETSDEEYAVTRKIVDLIVTYYLEGLYNIARNLDGAYRLIEKVLIGENLEEIEKQELKLLLDENIGDQVIDLFEILQNLLSRHLNHHKIRRIILQDPTLLQINSLCSHCECLVKAYRHRYV